MHRTSTQAPSDHQVGFFIALCCAHALFALPISASVEWTGRIYDAEGNPVPSALITFFPESATHHSHSTYSDSTGTYRLSSPDHSSGHVRIEALGYKPLSQPVDPGRQSSALDFHLELHPLLMDELVIHRRRSEDDASFVEKISVDRSNGSLVQVLDAATGLNIRRYGGLGSFSTVSIRGSTAEQVQVFLDGVPLNSASGGGVDIGRLPLAGVQQIEIHRGNVPSQLGGNSIGGVVHMRTRGLDAPEHTRLNASGGSFRTRQLGLSHGSRLGPWSYLSLLDYSASDNTFRFWDDNGTEYNNQDDEWATRRNSDFSSLRLLNKVGRAIGTYRLQVHSTLDWSHKGLPGLGNNQSLSTRFDTWRHMVEANLYGARASGHTFRLKSYYTEQRDTYKDLLGEVGTGLQHQHNATQSYGLHGEVGILMPSEILSNVFASIHQERFTPRNRLRPERSAYTNRRRSATLGIQAEKSLLGDRLAAHVGGQGEWQKNRFLTPGPLVFSPDITHRSSDALWGIRMGLSARLNAQFNVQIHRGIYRRAPSFFELFGDRGAVMGNPDLQRETGHNSDIGLMYRSTDARPTTLSLFELTYYHNRVSDLIRFIHNSQQVSRPYNIGQALLRGLEARWQVQALSLLTLSGNYTYQRAENRAPFSFERGNDLPNAPRHRLSNRLDMARSSWQCWFEYQRESQHYLDRANLRPVARRTLYHGGLRRDLKPSTALAFEVRNITDNQVADLWGYPLPGRSYMMTLDHSFTRP